MLTFIKPLQAKLKLTTYFKFHTKTVNIYILHLKYIQNVSTYMFSNLPNKYFFKFQLSFSIIKKIIAKRKLAKSTFVSLEVDLDSRVASAVKDLSGMDTLDLAQLSCVASK